MKPSNVEHRSSKILLIRLSSMGDVVLTIPVIRRLRDLRPDAHITALVKEEYSGLLKQEPALSEILVFRRGESLLSLCLRVRQHSFDSILDLHANLRSRLIGLFSGTPHLIRYRKATLARRLFVGWRKRSRSLESHTLERYLEALHQLVPEAAAKVPRKVLLIQTAFLGDAVLTTPLLGALQERFPDAMITVLCTPEVQHVFQGHPAVAEMILFDKRGHQTSLRAQWRLARSLNEKRYDLAVIPHRSFTSAWMAWAARIPRRIGFSTSQGRWLLTDVVRFEWGVHDADRNLALLKAVGVAKPAGRLWIKPDPSVLQSVNQRLASQGVSSNDRLIGINAGSVWPTKRWLPEGFAQVADRLIRDYGVRVVYVGGPNDRPVMAEVARGMKEKALSWVGETSLPELIALISRCRVFLTNDSGPMHIAVACGIPTVAIFGPTTRELGFFPYGPGHLVIEKDLPCRPCGLHGAKRCPLSHFRCMKDITPDEVLSAVKWQLT